MSNPKVSVIIPCYKTEQYLANCLDSVINQTYKNLEIIVVDDCSPDNSGAILETYRQRDSRIVILKHEQNKGLFQVRLTGIKHATGDYVCFVDSDDEISMDWIRLLVAEALKEKADIVVGNTVNIEDDWKHYFNNSINFTKFKKPLESGEILTKFFEQKGACYHWHTVWNKLYSIELWRTALPYLEKQTKHLIMTEDIAFTVVLFYFAKKLVFKNCDCYFYYKRKGASTDRAHNETKLISTLFDVGTVFDFLESFLTSLTDNALFLQGLADLKDKYFRIWCHTVIEDFPNNKEVQKIILSIFKKQALENTKPDDFYFYQVTTEWNENYENIKKMIANPRYPVISFDIFDTLITRPLWEPSDIYIIMSKPAADLLKIKSTSQFCEMRKNAENIARGRSKGKEDILIEDIYNCFADIYSVDSDVCDKLCELEISLEKKYCHRRESGVELLEMAKAIGKKVVLTSDMYLSKSTIIEILDGLNIKGYDDIYLSSDLGLLKSSGNLFRYVYKKEGIEPNKIIHIGDNWATDIDMARSVGFEALFFAKTKDIFANKIANIPVGNFMAPYAEYNNSWQKTSLALKDFPIRSLLAMVANKFFDRPNYSFQKESDYNGDMFFIGYYNLGFFLIGLTKWLQQRLADKKCTDIKFLARDGYMPKMAFDSLSAIDPRFKDITSDYFFASRKALMPYSMNSKRDFYSISTYINLYAHTPLTVLKLLRNVIPPVDDKQLNQYKKEGIIPEKRFTSYDDFRKFIDKFLQISFDEEYYNAKVQAVKKYYKDNFTENTAVFDLGYSGKLPQIINNLCEKRIDTFFVHNAAGATKIALDNNFRIENFLDFSPAISGVVIEYFLSSISGSCIGYYDKKGKITPIIEENNIDYETEYPIATIQDGAREFIDDYVKYFADITQMFEFNNFEVFAPMLYYLCGAKKFDIYFFNYTMLEDELYGGKTEISFLEIYDYYYKSSHLDQDGVVQNNPVSVVYKNVFALPGNWSKLKKAIYYFLFDNKTFWQKYKKWKEIRKANKLLNSY